MEQVIARDVAEQEIDRIAEYFETDLDEDNREILVKAYMFGRISCDEQTEKITVTLRKPVELENGSTVQSIELYEPSVQQMRDAAKVKDEFEQTLRLISYLSGHSLGEIARIKQKDIVVIGVVQSFFI